MKTYIIATIAICLSACAPVAYPPGTPNPLDEPGETLPTVEDLHLKNFQLITENPAYR